MENADKAALLKKDAGYRYSSNKTVIFSYHSLLKPIFLQNSSV